MPTPQLFYSKILSPPVNQTCFATFLVRYIVVVLYSKFGTGNPSDKLFPVKHLLSRRSFECVHRETTQIPGIGVILAVV